jgi:hypothetical protein
MARVAMHCEGIEGAVITSCVERCIELSWFTWGSGHESNKALNGSAFQASPTSAREVTITMRSDEAATPPVRMGLSCNIVSAVKFTSTSTAKDKLATHVAFVLSA